MNNVARNTYTEAVKRFAAGALVMVGTTVAFSFVVLIGNVLPALYKPFKSPVQKISAGLSFCAARIYARFLRPCYQKVLRPMMRRVNQFLINPIAYVVCAAVLFAVVKPLGSLMRLGASVCGFLVGRGVSLLSSFLSTALYQQGLKPFLVRPLLRFFQLMTRVFVDFPAQMLAWSVCAVLTLILQGGEGLSVLGSHCTRVAQDMCADLKKQIVSLYKAYDSFALVSVVNPASSEGLRRPPLTPGKEVSFEPGSTKKSRAVVTPKAVGI